jgi:hypothetical protein
MSEESTEGRGVGLRSYSTSIEARKDARNEGDNRSWSRTRELPLPNLIYGIYGEAALSGAMEIRRIFKQEGKDPDEAVTNQDYLARRRLLNPKVFKVSNKVYLKPFYAGNEARTWHKYLALGVDGSKFEIANSKENHAEYGSEDKVKGEAVARCLYGALCDLLNGFILTIDIESVHGNEIDEAKKNMALVRDIIGEREAVIVFDRNYPSIELIQFIEKQGFKYVIRLSSEDYKAERSKIKGRDETIEIKHTRQRLYSIKKRDEAAARALAEKGVTEARIIKMEFRDGDGALITNLGKEIKAGEIRKLYCKRWEVEKSFHALKNKMNGEYCAGKKSLYVKQNFWASVVVHNIVTDLMHVANWHVVRDCKKKGYKYKMHVNENTAIGHFKDQYVAMIMEEDNDKKTKLYDKLWNSMRRHVLPYRDLPSTKRKWNHANKNKQNLKPSY